MGQKDPLAEWQREGFDMFEAMMGLIQDNFVQYVSHVQVATVADAPVAPSTKGMKYISADDSVQGAAALRATAASMQPDELVGDFDPDAGERSPMPRNGGAAEEVVQVPVRRREDPGPQRALLLRERQEVQALPRSLSAAGRLSALRCATSHRTSPIFAAASRRRASISGSTPRAARIVELEEQVSKPDLWDDQALARKVTTELARRPRRRRALRRARPAALRPRDARGARARRE